LRLQLLARGYAVLPCRGKVPAIHGWSDVDYVASQISDGPRGTRAARVESWERRFSRAVTTGVRVENGLVVIDIDVNDAQMVLEIISAIETIAPEVWSRAPTRFGGGDKVAMFCRLDGEAFTRVPQTTRKYRRPEDDDSKYHAIEIFGGKPSRYGSCSRQFAVYGPRSYADAGEVESEYRWDPDLPALHDVELTDLPLLSKDQAYAIVAAFEKLAGLHGWVQLTTLDEGDGEGRDVYDIDREASRFEVYGGEEVSYAELEALVFVQENLRVSANFIAGETSTTPDRCSVRWSDRHDCVRIKDWKTAAWHYPSDLEKVAPEDIAEAIRGVADDAGVEVPKPEPNWRERYINLRPKASLHNARLAIVSSDLHCTLNTFHGRMYIGRSDAASPREPAPPFLGKVTDINIGLLRVSLSNTYGLDFTDKHIRDAVTTLASQYPFNPITDMLAEAEANWDGVERLDRMAVDYFNCEDTEFNRAVVRKTMIAAVARARTPGCKFDTILVMESKEGWNKSSAWAVLAGEGNFSDERIIGKDSREVQEQLSIAWIHENADLAGMGKAEVETVKAFASRQVDRARPAYGHFLVEQPRHSIDVATTNADRYLMSQTGNRRFWPIEIRSAIDLRKLRAARLQLWGEAAHWHSAGESLVLPEALWAAAGDVQEERRVRHPWEAILATIVSVVDDSPAAGAGSIGAAIAHRVLDEERVPTRLIFEHLLKVPSGQLHNGHSKTLAEVMRLLGWRNGMFKYQGLTTKGYIRTTK
jgi:hypothetical protein